MVLYYLVADVRYSRGISCNSCFFKNRTDALKKLEEWQRQDRGIYRYKEIPFSCVKRLYCIKDTDYNSPYGTYIGEWNFPFPE
jgi:hypothetical protein